MSDRANGRSHLDDRHIGLLGPSVRSVTGAVPWNLRRRPVRSRPFGIHKRRFDSEQRNPN